jgi:glucan 1,3-beta-glucosidase
MQRPHARLLLVLLVPLLLALWAWQGRPVDLVDAPDGRFQCASYTPPRDEPMRADTRIPREQIRRELAVLAPRFGCVRTYSVNNGMDAVPEVARELGLRVLLGLWIGSDPLHNQREIERGLAVAAAAGDVIDGIIVGNEVLLRRELTAAQLEPLLRQVNDATDLPVTYADVWDFWRTNPQLQHAVDYLTIHLLPYWENEPSGIDAALRHTAEMWGEARVTFPDKRLFIGETGWPSAGRQREDAVPGTLNQARFLREFTDWARREGAPYNLIEAFDQAWKRGQEGTVGGHWGLYTADLTPKFPLQGPVTADTRWWRGPAAGVAGALLLLALARGSRWRGATTLPVAALGGAALGLLLPWQWDYALAASRSTVEAGVLALLWLAGSLLFAKTVLRWQEPAAPAGVASLLASLDRRRPLDGSRLPQHRLAGLLRFIVLAGAAHVALGLALDGRYRGFPVVFYVLPAIALLQRAAARTPTDTAMAGWRGQAEEAVLAWVVALGSLVFMALEGPLNLQSLAMGASGLLLAFAVLWPLHGRRVAGDDQQGQ